MVEQNQQIIPESEIQENELDQTAETKGSKDFELKNFEMESQATESVPIIDEATDEVQVPEQEIKRGYFDPDLEGGREKRVKKRTVRFEESVHSCDSVQRIVIR